MPQTKQITINSQDFTTLENVFYTHLKHKHQDTKALKLIQKIINQCLD